MIDLTVLKKTDFSRLESKVLSLVKLCSIPYFLEPSPKPLIWRILNTKSWPYRVSGNLKIFCGGGGGGGRVGTRPV